MEEPGLIRLSRLSEVVTGIVVATEGYSVLERWHDGRLTWLVEHDASRGAADLVIDAGPSFVWPFHRRVPQFSRRTGRPCVDAIPACGIPFMLSEALTGFRPDRLPAGFWHQPFEVLADVEVPTTSSVDGFGRENWTYDTATSGASYRGSRLRSISKYPVYNWLRSGLLWMIPLGMDRCPEVARGPISPVDPAIRGE